MHETKMHSWQKWVLGNILAYNWILLTGNFELPIELIDGTVEGKGADPCSPKCSLQGDNYWHRQLTNLVSSE